MTIGSTTSSEPSTKKIPGLRVNALGFPTLLAQSVALISPTMTAVSSFRSPSPARGRARGWPTPSGR